MCYTIITKTTKVEVYVMLIDIGKNGYEDYKDVKTIDDCFDIIQDCISYEFLQVLKDFIEEDRFSICEECPHEWME